MKELLADLDPIFMATAVMIGGLMLASHMPNPPVFLDHPSLEGMLSPEWPGYPPTPFS